MLVPGFAIGMLLLKNFKICRNYNITLLYCKCIGSYPSELAHVGVAYVSPNMVKWLQYYQSDKSTNDWNPSSVHCHWHRI